ncbi:MAG: hypothetical protein KIT16_08720, partial [Rhodospirillaceae bacterium]|nr:hypothetical protein [Rhodospirillaceae bacterium]
MTGAEKTETLRFEPLGPGSWELDAVHFPRPLTRYWTELHPDACSRGVREFTRFYGMMIDSLEYRYVNGFAYLGVKPIEPAEAPLRFQRAEEVFANKLWREQLAEWDDRVKPASIAAHKALQAIDPAALSDGELATHLGRCRDRHAEMLFQHMRFTAAAVVPTGDFLAHVGEWSGASPADLLGLLRGTAPVSAGASAELERLIAAIGRDEAAQKLLASNDEPGQIIAALRALKSDTGAAAAAYLDLVGCRLLDGFDISGPVALELPDALLRAIRAAVGGRESKASDLDKRVAEVRDRVPDKHRAAFDELLAEARLTYRIRDERGVFSDIWASGIMRRSAMAAGRRLAAKGRLHEAVHFVDAGIDEMRALVAGAGGPSADELRQRAQYRASRSAKDAPATLGPPAPPPPDPKGLPPAAGRMMHAVGITLGSIFGSSDAPQEKLKLRGLAASRGVYEGTARRVSNPAEFDRIVQGDVLVTESTT